MAGRTLSLLLVVGISVAGAAASQRSLLQSNSSSNGSSIPPVTSSVSPSPSPAAGRSRPGSVDRWAAPGTPSPPGYICKQWYDVSGNDLTTLASILTADACAAACKAMAGCSHFVLTPACVLRGDLYAGAAGANGASGNVTLACIGITDTNYACASGWTLAGKEVAKYLATPPNACREACVFTPACRFYQSDWATSTCILKTAPLLGKDGETRQGGLSVNTCGVDVGAASIVRSLDDDSICQGVPGMCNVPVSKAVIAGTHNSASYNIPPSPKDLLKFRPFNTSTTRTVTQSLGAVQGLVSNQRVAPRIQLADGIRMVDLDVCLWTNPLTNNSIAIFCHGAFDNPLNPNPRTVFNQIYQAAARAPRDIVIIRMANVGPGSADGAFTGLNGAQKEAWRVARIKAARVSTLNQLAASGLMNRVYRGTVNDTVTVRDITRTGKNVLIVWAREWLSYDAPNGGAGYMVGRYYVKTIPSFELYGGGANVLAPPVQAKPLISQAIFKMWNDSVPDFNSAVLTFNGPFPSFCVPGLEACAVMTNTPGFIMYMLLFRVIEAVERFNLPLPTDHSPSAGGVHVDYYRSGLGFSHWAQAATKANIGWVLDYGVLTSGRGGGFDQCVQLFNRGTLQADLVCKGRPQAVEYITGAVTHVFVPPGVKFTVLWRDRPLGATITGAPVTGSLVATAGDATRSWGLGWQAVYVQ